MRRRPDILLLVLDTLRADRLQSYGSSEAITPAVDALAEESTLFRFAIAPAQWSIPSHASLFTGVYPSIHDTTQSNSILPEGLPTLAERLRDAGYYTAAFCNNPLVGVINNGLRRGFDSFLNYAGLWTSRPNQAGARPGAYDRIRQRFKGWLTDLITRTQDAFARNDVLLELSLTPLFVPMWQTALSFKGNSRKSLDNAAQLFIRRDGLAPDQPIFAFINLMGIHMPYRAPQPYVQRFAPRVLRDPSARRFLRQFNTDAFGWLAPLADPVDSEHKAVLDGMYNAEAAYQDHLVGQFFDRLRQAGRLDQSVVIILSDHGDHLGEHQLIGHSTSLYNELVHVPLIIRDGTGAFPAGAAVDHFISTRRVFHTALTAAGAASDAERALTLAEDVRGQPERGVAFSESIPALNFLRMINKRRPDLTRMYALDQYRIAVCSDNHKLIQVGADRFELYNVINDPAEVHNLSRLQPDRLENMRRLIADFTRQASDAGQTAGISLGEPDAAVAQRLRSLGYLD